MKREAVAVEHDRGDTAVTEVSHVAGTIPASCPRLDIPIAAI
jgi:hypothetical protein